MTISEANRGASIPHFTWFFQETYVSTPRTAHPLHSAEINPEIGFAAVPLRSCAPPNEATRNLDVESVPAPIPSKKQRISGEVANVLPGETFPNMETKKRSKKSKKKVTTGQSTVKHERKDLDLGLNNVGMDISGVPSPVCTCTGVPRQCYKWGAGRWQSSCCTTNLSQYPLPMRPSRPGSRMSGRKMSHGAYVKLLQRLAAEGHDLSTPVDLKLHWAKLGTNKFVTIR